MKASPRRIGNFIALGVVASLIAWLVIFVAHWYWQKGQSTLSWLETPCTVNFSKVQVEDDIRWEFRLRQRFDSKQRYFVSAKFSYTVNGRSYINGRYAAYRSEVSREEAQRIVRDLPIGLKNYDPKNPGQAVFKRGRP
jgi:hypothetical protein